MHDDPPPGWPSPQQPTDRPPHYGQPPQYGQSPYDQPYGGPSYPQPYGAQPGPRPSASPMAIASIVLACGAWVLCGCVMSLPAAIIARVELDAIARGDSPEAGRSLAQAAWWISIANLALYVLGGVVYAAIIAITVVMAKVSPLLDFTQPANGVADESACGPSSPASSCRPSPPPLAA